ncbi:NAD(P)-binding protein [Exidia glandulosa HHB12029]|uniref:D-xylose 1-dehydrogenase (NADP(+), D-xylono-1,5-lactone-forming) n=1 Tax=Exidia glandulosa HHB12029 TaxID=1314781 RepID=A0A165GIJ0_EXIGL|nr:NAD(P)-binding protein [Exidia glandulosa HHB12029]
MAAPYELKWGILATGGIAKLFVKDLLLDPSTRDVTDVKHKVVAIGSSSSKASAEQFIEFVEADKNTTRAYGSYAEVLQDPDVQIVYVASPQSHHYDNVLEALRAGKHVCCEKPFTINAKQTAHLIRLARERKLFLMEAVWTRFFPITREIVRLLHTERVLGPIQRVWGDFSRLFDPSPEHRLFKPELGGGALLDLGVYPITWNFIALYEQNGRKGPSEVRGTILKARGYDVDEYTSVSMVWDNGESQAVGTASCSLSVQTPRAYCVAIQGEKGDLLVEWPPYRPETYILQLKGKEPVKKTFPVPGQGLFWEADACARALRDGKLEADEYTLEESLAVMEVLDRARETAGYAFPGKLEKVYSE